MSLQLNRTNCFKLLITIFCIIGFTYHTISLTIEYMSGKTIVNLFIGTLFKEGLPAITICPQKFAIDKIANLSEPLTILYKDYVSLDINSTNYKLEQRKIYSQASNHVEKMLKNGSLNIGNMFYNYTESYNENPSIKFFVWEYDRDLKRLFNLSTISMINGVEFYQIVPIESIRLYKTLKCYTFFSHLDPIWKIADIDFKNIRILVQLDDLSYPYMSRPVPFILHSPNDLPLLEAGKVISDFKMAINFLLNCNKMTDCYGISLLIFLEYSNYSCSIFLNFLRIKFC